MALIATDLPEPVDPAMSTCGIDARSAVTMRPLMSLPMASVSRERALANVSTLDHVAQVNRFALVIRHLDAHGALARHALDQDALGAHRQAQVVGQASHARVLYARFGLELVGRHHGPGIDLHHLPAHVELAALLHEHLGFFAQLVLAHRLRTVAGVEQRAGRQLEAAHILRRDGHCAHLGIGAAVDGNLAVWAVAQRQSARASAGLLAAAARARRSGRHLLRG